MREIKFRGRTPSGKWVYGDLHIRTIHPHIHTEPCSKSIIDSDTIGQFTGLHDKSGKEIYEGDIVSVKSDDNSLDIACIAWHEYLAQFYYKFKGDGSQSINDQKATIRDIMNYYEVEVIGNIYDNQK